MDDEVEFRPATEADFAAEHDVFADASGGLLRRHGFETPEPTAEDAERFTRTHTHLLAHDGERSFVAEVAGAVVGFSDAIVRGDTWFLSMLFIRERFQGRGIGRRLLELSWGEGHARRLTISSAIQPISNGLYAQRGLVPATPMLPLAGEPRIDAPPGLDAVAPEPDAIATLDRAAYGFDRRVDHAFWSQGATATLWLRDGEPAAYSYRSGEGAIGPVAGADPESAAAALQAELARGEGPAGVAIPGSARELVETALAAGLRFEAPPGLLLLSAGVAQPRSLAIGSYGLL
ncbi:MAG TPA: GNAT family N-acetyltransferase [Gaiellaceae bacterium]